MENAPVLVDLGGRVSIKADDSDPEGDNDPTPEEQNLQNVIAHFNGDD